MSLFFFAAIQFSQASASKAQGLPPDSEELAHCVTAFQMLSVDYEKFEDANRTAQEVLRAHYERIRGDRTDLELDREIRELLTQQLKQKRVAIAQTMSTAGKTAAMDELAAERSRCVEVVRIEMEKVALQP